MSKTREVNIKVNEALFKQMLREQQRDYTHRAVEIAFQAWKKSNADTIHAEVTKYLDKEMPNLIKAELPKLAKGFYCGFES
jgi:hypothetical protein